MQHPTDHRQYNSIRNTKTNDYSLLPLQTGLQHQQKDSKAKYTFVPKFTWAREDYK